MILPVPNKLKITIPQNFVTGQVVGPSTMLKINLSNSSSLSVILRVNDIMQFILSLLAVSLSNQSKYPRYKKRSDAVLSVFTKGKSLTIHLKWRIVVLP